MEQNEKRKKNYAALTPSNLEHVIQKFSVLVAQQQQK